MSKYRYLRSYLNSIRHNATALTTANTGHNGNAIRYAAQGALDIVGRIPHPESIRYDLNEIIREVDNMQNGGKVGLRLNGINSYRRSILLFCNWASNELDNLENMESSQNQEKETNDEEE